MQARLREVVTAFFKISSESSPPKSTRPLLLHNGIYNPPCLVSSNSLLGLHQKHQEQGILLSLPNKIPSSQVSFLYTLSSRRKGSSTQCAELICACIVGKAKPITMRENVSSLKPRTVMQHRNTGS